MKVVQSTGGGAYMLMECDEEKQVWPQPHRDDDEEEEEGHDEAQEAFISPMEEEQEEEEQQQQQEEEEDMTPPPIRIVHIPFYPITSCSPPPQKQPLQCAGALGFTVNGRLVSAGGAAELKLLSHPGGSLSGFTRTETPQPNETSTCLTPNAAAPVAEPTPIITGVVSGEAAQKVLINHSVNDLSSPPPAPPLTSAGTDPPAPHGSKASPVTQRPPARHQQHRGFYCLSHLSVSPVCLTCSSPSGEQGPVSPPNCLACKSQFRLITELRGFMCLCSPDVAESLMNLRKRRRRSSHHRRRSPRSPMSPMSPQSRTRTAGLPSKVSPQQQRTVSVPDHYLSEQVRSDPPEPPQGKLVIMVEDFYYGHDSGRSSADTEETGHGHTGPFRCIRCSMMLRNNIQLMSHMQDHMSMMSEEDRDSEPDSTCPHCFRHFLSPFRLKCHLEAVHSQYESTAKCKICELDFGTEASFLWHMKNTHKPGEMPYLCQVCDFRSSFFSDVWCHFEQVHVNTNLLMCQFCLRVMRSSSCFQQHVSRHQKKQVFSCDKCRLHFLYVRERIEHSLLHKTHIRPQQLTGLKPGTKVTVRTYSVVPPCDSEAVKKAPLRVVDVEPPPLRQVVPRRRQVELLGRLLTHLRENSGDADFSPVCVECLSAIGDFPSHFPSLVHCSLCRFLTCCSTTYANHMINNHSSRLKPQYSNMFVCQPRLRQTLRCVSCSFFTCRGDVMANHLTERPTHHCMLTRNGKMKPQTTNTCNSVMSPQGGGAFIPIHLLPDTHTSHLSVKPLLCPSPLSSPPAMTIKFVGPRPQPAGQVQRLVSLSTSQLSIVLFALCYGFPQAARRYRISTRVIRSWIRVQERLVLDRKWCWRADEAAEWVLSRREQQLPVSEEVLLQMASRAVEGEEQEQERYSWSVDFLLRHGLSLQPTDTDQNQNQLRRLPRVIRDRSRRYVNTLSDTLDSNLFPPHGVGFMDEFSIFVDPDQNSSSAFRLFGSAEDRPVFDVVLSALSDGTFLPPLLFMRGTPFAVPPGFPGNVQLWVQQDGFTDSERLRTWMEQVWRPRVASTCPHSLLMFDIHRGHMTDDFRAQLNRSSTQTFFIPSGCSCRLQPLHVCLTPVLREYLQARWTQLSQEDLGLDHVALTLSCWLSEVSSVLNADKHYLHRSFSAVCNLQGPEDQMKAAAMIQRLKRLLVQPLTRLRPGPGPGPGVRLKEKNEEVGEVKGLQQIFDGESDQESFHGFHDD